MWNKIASLPPYVYEESCVWQYAINHRHASRCWGYQSYSGRVKGAVRIVTQSNHALQALTRLVWNSTSINRTRRQYCVRVSKTSTLYF